MEIGMAKKHPEYDRGFKFGLDAGREMFSKYGRAFAEHQVEQLAANARQRGKSPDERAFDRGYTEGYRAALIR
jgi:hypothetical protein